MGDSSGLIYCAGDALFEKVASYAGKDTSRYQVTGYLSIYLGQPELYVPDKSYFIYDSSLDVSSDVTSLINEEKTINDVYDCFTNINYNCAGHGYGGFYVLKGLTCFYTDSNTYYFTDGEHVVKGVKVTSSCSVGGVYDLYGVLSLQNYSPAIIVLKAKNNSSASKKEITASNVSLTLGSVELRKKKNSQDDTDNRYPEFIQMFKNPYKSGPIYMGLCVENSKYYVTYRDTYLDSIVDGKTNAGANYGSIFVDNNNFWNVSSSDLSYNPYADYLLEDNTVTNLYYIPQQLTYSSGKTIWKVLLLPISINI